MRTAIVCILIIMAGLYFTSILPEPFPNSPTQIAINDEGLELLNQVDLDAANMLDVILEDERPAKFIWDRMDVDQSERYA